jgi:hypothetical protein
MSKSEIRSCLLVSSKNTYEGRLQISWTHLITPSRNLVRGVPFFEVPSMASDELLTTLHPFLENVLQTVDHFDISCLETPFSWLEKSRNLTGRDLSWILCSAWKKWIGGTPIRTSTIQSRSRPMRFLGFSNYEKGALRQEISKCLTVCRTFYRSGWSVVRSASLAKGGTSKKTPSPHLHKVPTPSNKLCPRTLQMVLVYQ